MLWIILIINVITLFFILGLVGGMSTIEKKMNGIINTQAMIVAEPQQDFIQTPAADYIKTKKKKQAMKVATNLKKKSNVAK